MTRLDHEISIPISPEEAAQVDDKDSERGSALLIVFVFAAIAAITLYMELPVAAFEAQRQKEQLLVDTGDEYAHAVKLFVRKVGRYPTSIKELDETNRMRFLRRDLPDPFTGKTDWRLLHAGPGGVIIDSKVNPNPLGNVAQNGNGNPGPTSNNGSFGATGNSTGFQNSSNSSSGFGSSPSSSNSGFGNSTNSGFGNSTSTGFGSTSANTGGATGSNTMSSSPSSAADSNTPGVVVQQPRQRGPAVSANGSQPGANPQDSNANTASPPLPPDTLPGANAANTATATAPGSTPPSGVPSPQGGIPTSAPNGTAQNPNGTAQGPNGTTPDLKANMLAAAGPGGAQTSSFGATNGSPSSQMGAMNGGGLAGVASKAIGHSIKTVNDQSNYSLWEFYYDPKKDTTPGGVQMGAFSQQNGATGGPQTGPNGQTSGAFGSSSFGQSSGFGQNSSSGLGQNSGSGQSSFGNNSNSPNSSFGQSNTNQNPQPNNQISPQ